MFTLYGIKTCGTVRKARAWLEQHQIEYQFHDFRIDGLTAEQVQGFLHYVSWQELINRQSSSWRQLNAEQRTALDSEQGLALLLTVPTVIKRPLLLADKHLLVGFSTARYQNLL